MVWTIGHSTRPLQELIALLQAHGVQTLVDVRSVPRSRHNPQYDRSTLPQALAAESIDYLHEPRLGGLRHPRRESINTGWRVAGFRGFADHMQSPEFASGLARLVAYSTRSRTAVMCAEAVPWRCHRSLIADALVARGIEVRHILGEARADRHRLTPFAKLDGTRVTYPRRIDPGAS